MGERTAMNSRDRWGREEEDGSESTVLLVVDDEEGGAGPVCFFLNTED